MLFRTAFLPTGLVLALAPMAVQALAHAPSPATDPPSVTAPLPQPPVANPVVPIASPTPSPVVPIAVPPPKPAPTGPVLTPESASPPSSAPGLVPAPTPPDLGTAQMAAALPAAIIDPGARALFTQMVAAHRALGRFTLTLDTQDVENGSVKPAPVGHSRIAYLSQSQFSVTLAQNGKTLGQLIRNGNTFFRVDAGTKSYRKDTLPPNRLEGLAQSVIGQLGWVPRSIVDPNGLSSLLTTPNLVAFARGPENTSVGAVPVDTLVARLVAPDGSQNVFTFAVGQKDHLLRQIVIDEQIPASTQRKTPARTETHTETVTALQANPTLSPSLFTYKPAAGYKKVAGSS